MIRHSAGIDLALDNELSEHAAKTERELAKEVATDITKKVCVVAPVHVWDDVRVFHKECRTLADAGCEVCLIARIGSARTIDDVRIIPPIGSSGSRFVRFLSLPLVGIQALRQKADIYHLHNPDTIPLIALLRIAGKTVIYDTHEDFSKRILIRKWIPAWLRSPLARLVAKAESLISTMTAASIATQQDVVDRLGNKALLLGNAPRVDGKIYADTHRYAQEIEKQDGWVRAIYIGRIDQDRGLCEMVDAMEIANRTTPVRLWLIGPADQDDLDRASRQPGWDYVDYIPAIAQEMAFAYVERSDVGLVVMRDVGGNSKIEPNKLFEYMVFSKPFIASAFDAWVEMLAGIDAGWYVQPGCAKDVAAALIEFAGNRTEAVQMGARGRKFTESYNWETESQKLLNLYRAL